MKHILLVYTGMTRRQQEILRFVTYGYSNREVGEQLFISTQVVADHLTVIYEELHNALAGDINRRPNRPILIRYGTMLFQHYPDLIPDDEQAKM